MREVEMDYEVGDWVVFDGGPAKIIGRSTEERTYLVEFTGLTGKRSKTVTSRDLQDIPSTEEGLSHDDLEIENARLRMEIERLKKEKIVGVDYWRTLYFAIKEKSGLTYDDF